MLNHVLSILNNHVSWNIIKYNINYILLHIKLTIIFVSIWWYWVHLASMFVTNEGHISTKSWKLLKINWFIHFVWNFVYPTKSHMPLSVLYGITIVLCKKGYCYVISNTMNNWYQITHIRISIALFFVKKIYEGYVGTDLKIRVLF